ncbi:MAG TPA: FAD-binding oxidoreductase [Gaiellaceae bacterium]|nr:FAD-binding oxidoreductase [Gaiellaceae bacterium]HZT53688.1 FAD-binding oxidoreductase [Gaiellaceae bacterium]
MPSVCEVASLAEASALLREASARGRTVSIERAGGEVELRTARLDRILEHEPGDLTCVVEAGLRLSELNERLRPFGQRLPLDPSGDPTVGACLAGDLSGPRRHRHGTMRDLVIGATVVLGDGTVASSGGKVVKNVAGYDLAKLFCGSRGLLGLVGRIALRLSPVPEASRALRVRSGTLQEACAKARAIVRSSLEPSALDLTWPGCDLLVLFEGSARAVGAQLETARSLVGGADEQAWGAVDDCRPLAAGRVPVTLGSIPDVLPRYERAVACVGAGVAHTVAPEPPDPRDPVEIALVERIRAAFDPAGVLV